MALRHEFPFDPSHGYTLETLLEVKPPEPPADFVEFWRATYSATRAIPTAVDRRPVPSPLPDSDLCEIEYASLGGRCGGWLWVPRGEVRRLLVMGHGYGGRAEPAVCPELPATAVLSPCARGFHRSGVEGVPASAAGHVLHGIGSRETYIHRFNVAELWSAGTVMCELFPQASARLLYRGASFGGGLGAMMLPWDDRFVRAALEVPSLGHHPLRLELPCRGAGAAVRAYHERRGDVLPVLRYFDAATAARFIRQPTLLACALFDPSVPPAGQFAVHNAIPGDKKLVVATAGHFEYPELAADLAKFEAEVAAWFT